MSALPKPQWYPGRTRRPTSKVEWYRPDQRMPDADINVLIGMRDGDCVGGFFDGEQWRDTTAWVIPTENVALWADFPEVPKC